MKIGVYTNLNKDYDSATAKELAPILQQKGASYKVYNDRKKESDTTENL